MVSQGGAYAELRHDLKWYHPTAFFYLHRKMTHKPNIRIMKRRKEHRVGTMSFLFKYKYWEKIKAGEVFWEDIKFRPLCSYLHNLWRRWYSHAGKTCSALAKIAYPLGDGIEAERAVLRRLARAERLPPPLGDPDCDECGDWEDDCDDTTAADNSTVDDRSDDSDWEWH